MKTWGLNKKTSVHTWGLGGVFGPVIQSWKEIIKFSLYLARTFKTILER